MLINDTLTIEFPQLVETDRGISVATSCDSNGNYYTSGEQRSTCCCGCDKD